MRKLQVIVSSISWRVALLHDSLVAYNLGKVEVKFSRLVIRQLAMRLPFSLDRHDTTGRGLLAYRVVTACPYLGLVVHDSLLFLPVELLDRG